MPRTGPTGVKGLGGLRQRIDDQGGEPLYLLVGDDRKELESALGFLEERLVDEDLRSMNSARLRGSETTTDELMATCSTLPMLSEQRLVVLREPEKLSGDESALLAYLADPCPSTALVLVPAEFDRRRKLSQALERHACVVLFEAPGPRDLEAWVARTLGARGVELAPEAMELLQDLVEADTLLLSNELEKLALYCGKSKRAGRSDVEAVLGRTRAIDVWELTNAIEDGRPEAALAALGRLLDQGAAVPMLVGTLDWCLGRLFASAMTGAPPGRRRALEQRRRALRGRGEVVVGLLREADRQVRTTGGHPEAALEKAVLAAAR